MAVLVRCSDERVCLSFHSCLSFYGLAPVPTFSAVTRVHTLRHCMGCQPLHSIHCLCMHSMVSCSVLDCLCLPYHHVSLQ